MRVSNAREKETFIYFAESQTYDTKNQKAFKVSDFLGATAVAAENQTILRFFPQGKNRDAIGTSTITPDTVTITHTANAHVEILKGIGALMGKENGGFVIGHDEAGSLGKRGETDISFERIASTGVAVEISGVTIA